MTATRTTDAIESPVPAATVEELRAARARILERRRQGEAERADLRKRIEDRNFHAFMRGDAIAAADVARLQAELAEAERRDLADGILQDRLTLELAEADVAAAERARAAQLEQLEAQAATVAAVAAEIDRAVVDVVRPLAERFLAQAPALARYASMGGRTPEFALAQAVAAHLSDLAPLLRNLVDRRMRHVTLSDYANSLAVRARNNTAPPAAPKEAR